jgi:hypothetical protein
MPFFQRQNVGAASPDGDAASVVRPVLDSPGQPLDSTSRAFFESRLGYDFSGVRIHTDARAAESARSLDALAYTVGRDVVFGAGQYAPTTREGRRLLAHELAHVAQQRGDSAARSIQRDKPKSPGASAKAVKKAPGSAAKAQKLTLQPSKNGEPCACLIHIHNNERNARETVKLMHEHCSYNLTLLEPDDKQRRITLPQHTATVDPNELFPPDVAAQCTNDEKACRDFLTSKAGSTDKAEIEKWVQIQFFLTISDCSKGFTLPVVALHNNDVNDTRKYRSKITGPSDVKDLKLDVNKSTKESGEDQLKKIKDALKKMVGPDEVEEMTSKGKTNIFRWCVSGDLARCHIGDPEHPDNVTWVTREEDYETLSKKKINVALQSSAVKGGESETDLSTLFITLKTVLSDRSVKVIQDLEKAITTDEEGITRLFDDLAKLEKFGDARLSDRLGALIKALMLLFRILLRKFQKVLAKGIGEARVRSLRYINIETPGPRLRDQSDAERIRNYEAIVDVLSGVGLHCCPDQAKAEAAIKEGLKIDEKTKAEKKPKRKAAGK